MLSASGMSVVFTTGLKCFVRLLSQGCKTHIISRSFEGYRILRLSAYGWKIFLLSTPAGWFRLEMWNPESLSSQGYVLPMRPTEDAVSGLRTRTQAALFAAERKKARSGSIWPWAVPAPIDKCVFINLYLFWLRYISGGVSSHLQLQVDLDWLWKSCKSFQFAKKCSFRDWEFKNLYYEKYSDTCLFHAHEL